VIAAALRRVPRRSGHIFAANQWFSVKRLEGLCHFPTLEIPDVTAAEIERCIG
jgi:hypothetical protein